MNPQMKAQLDAVCSLAAEKYATTPIVMQFFISASLLITKLLVLGDAANDRKLDIRGSMQQIAREVTALEIQAVQFLPEPWDAKKVLEVQSWIDERVVPIVKLHYMGIQPEDGSVIQTSH